MIETWNLYLKRDYRALPWELDWLELTAEDVRVLPNSCSDFLRYAPNDAFGTQVPAKLPRELPRCETKFAMYHTPEHLYIFVQALVPEPIAGLADLVDESLSAAVQLPGLDRGIYAGLNQKGEHIVRPLVWEPLGQPKNAYEHWPWSNFPQNQWDPLPGYDARIWRDDDGLLVGAWRFERELFGIGEHFGISVGRQCCRTNELVSWGGPIVWDLRTAEMGAVTLVSDAAETADRPDLVRVDLKYDLDTDQGVVQTTWDNPWPEVSTPHHDLGSPNAGAYADYIPLQTVVLNGVAHTEQMQQVNEAVLPIQAGWNRLEVMTAVGSPQAVCFQKVSGHHIQAPKRVAGDFPSLAELRAAFARWHELHETGRTASGTWGGKTAGGNRPCLDHNGVFHSEPYAIALQVFGEDDPEWRERVVETAQRCLGEQRDEGWFPGYCGSGGTMSAPPPFRNGAFSHGSVGEAMALAYALTGDDIYLQSAKAAAEAYSLYRFEINQNYAAFALWHLAALYGVDPKVRWLEKAAWYAEHCVARAIDPAGCQDGHNYYCGYGGITLKGLAALLGVMPMSHPLRPRLRHWTLRFANQMLYRQQPNGRFHERNRKYLGYESLAPAGGLFFTTLADASVAEALQAPLAAVTCAALADVECGKGNDSNTGLVIALAGQFLTRRGG